MNNCSRLREENRLVDENESNKFEVDALGVITISRGCFERCGSNKKTPP